jgi:hypothetical protein
MVEWWSLPIEYGCNFGQDLPVHATTVFVSYHRRQPAMIYQQPRPG